MPLMAVTSNRLYYQALSHLAPFCYSCFASHVFHILPSMVVIMVIIACFSA